MKMRLQCLVCSVLMALSAIAVFAIGYLAGEVSVVKSVLSHALKEDLVMNLRMGNLVANGDYETLRKALDLQAYGKIQTLDRFTRNPLLIHVTEYRSPADEHFIKTRTQLEARVEAGGMGEGGAVLFPPANAGGIGVVGSGSPITGGRQETNTPSVPENGG